MQEDPVHGPSAGSCPVVHTQSAHLCIEGSVCNDGIIGQNAHLHLQPWGGKQSQHTLAPADDFKKNGCRAMHAPSSIVCAITL